MADPISLLQKRQANEKHSERLRSDVAYDPHYNFFLPEDDEYEYAQQYADLYYIRLDQLKKTVESRAESRWRNFTVAGEKAKRVPRVLDVKQGELSWAIGTIYVDLPYKPKVVDEVVSGLDISEYEPVPLYADPSVPPKIMLEDPSGQLRLSGKMLKRQLLVTGIVVAILGTETAKGEFEVIDMLFPDPAPQPERWQWHNQRQTPEHEMQVDAAAVKPKKQIAFVSGLELSDPDGDLSELDLLTQYLLGELGHQFAPVTAAQICRLVIVGNSFHPEISVLKPGEDIELLRAIQIEDPEHMMEPDEDEGLYDDQGYNPAPATVLDEFISELLPAIPVTLMAGQYDLTNRSLPQPPIHTAILPRSRTYGSENPDEPEEAPGPWFETVTNPWEGEIEGWHMLGHSGEALADIVSYFSARWPKGAGQDGRLKLMQDMLMWRCHAPTAPDTVTTYSFSDHDPLIMNECPHVFFIGNQPRFDTRMHEMGDGRKVRLINIPRFCETMEVVLLDVETLETEVVKFDAFEIDREELEKELEQLGEEEARRVQESNNKSNRKKKKKNGNEKKVHFAEIKDDGVEV